MRKPIVAGQFYPANKNKLMLTIKQCFEHELGKGKFPDKDTNKKIKAIISPHAGYIFSGPCMSHVFYEVGIAKTPDTYIIIGLSHHGFETCLSDEDFETPLDILPNNKNLTEQISKRCNIPINNQSHMHEHSLEVLLPFLQFVKPKENIKIVPLIIGQENMENLTAIGKSIKQTLRNYGKEVIFLVSSDFTHYGPNYGYYPNQNIKETDIKEINVKKTKDTDIVKNMDMKAIELIKKAKSKDLYDYHQETGITICGIHPIIAMLESINFKESELLSYYKSTDIMDSDNENSVSYAGIVFK